MTSQYRFTVSSGLTDASQSQVSDLLNLCNKCESLDIPIFPDHLASDHGTITAIAAWSDDTLAGFAAFPDDPHLEASLMVHPDHRLQGIGSQLVAAIRAEVVRRGLPSQLLVADQSSASAKPFFASLSISYEFSEFRLELDAMAIDRLRPRHDNLTLRIATPVDAQVLTRIMAAAFEDTESNTAPKIEHGLNETRRHFYIAELGGQPIGMLRAGEWDGLGDITAFAVHPDHQGKGYGRQILTDAIELLLSSNLPSIFIEVETDNRNALGLYESCGFKVISEFAYYRLTANG